MKAFLKFKKPVILAAFLLAVVFIIDLFTPLGIAIGVLYLFSFLLVCRQNKKTIITFAVLSSFLTVLKVVVFVTADINYYALLNRFISIFVIVVVAVISLRHRKLVEIIEEERARYIDELEQMMFLTSHKVRKPLATCLGLMDVIQSEKKQMNSEELNTIISHLKTSALELNAFTAELTAFIVKIEAKKIKGSKKGFVNEPQFLN